MNMKVQFPEILAIDTDWRGNPIQQLSQPHHSLEMIVEHHQENGNKGYHLILANDSNERILAISDSSSPPEKFHKVLKIKPGDLGGDDSSFVDLSGCEWVRHPEMFKGPEYLIDYAKRLKNVISSWRGVFLYLSEDRNNRVKGLRPPQIGAVHATHAHWTVTDQAATIVMPTGTGKTETMLSILVSKQCEKLLVVVPTDPLRTQVAGKFLTLGVLKDFGIVSDQALYPIVGVLKHKPKNRDEVDTFFGRCNVIVTTLDALRKWCSAIGRKVLDETIDPDEVLKGTLVQKIISQRPQKMPVCIAWPNVIYKEAETIFSFIVDGKEFPLFMTDIELITPSEDSELKFAIRSQETNLKLKLTLSDRDYHFSTIGNKTVSVNQGKNTLPIEDFFYRNPPMIWFVDGSSLEGNAYTELRKNFEPYPKEKIQTWNWQGIDITKETQGIMKVSDSIQYRVISELKKKNYDVIFDDDGSGEAADVVCIQVHKEVITVEFYHCKFSQRATPGSRIDDLYTVCGQAQKSTHWKWKEKENLIELFEHLLRREEIREGKKEISRFEKGTPDKLWEICEMSRDIHTELKIFIVQPGLSKSKASIDQLRLLSVTEAYLMETCQLPFGVIASD